MAADLFRTQIRIPTVLIFRTEFGDSVYKKVVTSFSEAVEVIKRCAPFCHTQVLLQRMKRIRYKGHSNPDICPGVSHGSICTCIDYEVSCEIDRLGFDIDPDEGLDPWMSLNRFNRFAVKHDIAYYAVHTGGGVQIFMPIKNFDQCNTLNHISIDDKLYSVHYWLDTKLSLGSDSGRWGDIAWRPRMSWTYNFKPKRNCYAVPISHDILSEGEKAVKLLSKGPPAAGAGKIYRLGGKGFFDASLVDDEIFGVYKRKKSRKSENIEIIKRDPISSVASEIISAFPTINIEYLQFVGSTRPGSGKTNVNGFKIIMHLLDNGPLIPEEIEIVLREYCNPEFFSVIKRKNQILYTYQYFLKNS